MIPYIFSLALFCSIVLSSSYIFAYYNSITKTYRQESFIRIQLLGSQSYSSAKSLCYSRQFELSHNYWDSIIQKPSKFKSKDPLWNYTDPYPYLSIYNSNVSICHENTFLLMMIPSRAVDFSIRNLFRNLYPQNNTVLNKVIHRVFVIAVSGVERFTMISLKKEAIKYNDIIIVNSPEGNIHLSKITWGAFYWITQYCFYANFIGKFDTDEIIILKNLVLKLLLLPKQKLYAGHVWKDVKTIPISTPGQRWVFPNDYPHIGFRRSYVSGVAEIFSVDIIPLLAVGAYYQDLFMTAGEDFMVGIILSKLGIQASQIDSNFVNVKTNLTKHICNYCVWHSPILKDFQTLKKYSSIIADCNTNS